MDLEYPAMDLEYPALEICHLDGKEDTIWLGNIFRQARDKNRITIGRSNDNDIMLPNPNSKVSRYHCAIERGIDACRWLLVDEKSRNGTYLQRGTGTTHIDVRSNGKLPLEDGNRIFILGDLLDQNKRIFWQLTFRDYLQTEEVEGFQLPLNLEYSLSQQQLFRITRWNREEIPLSGQEHALISCMAVQNLAENNQPNVCEYQKLIKAVWGEETYGHDNCDVSRLVFGLRKKIEPNPESPRFLKTVRNQGYLLDIKILS